MIYFITNKKDFYLKSIDTTLYSNITILNEEEGYNLYIKTLKGKRSVCLDIEASDLDAYRANLLLTGIKVKNSYFIFDYTIDTYKIVEPLMYKYVIGHNLKYDIKILKVNSGLLIKRLYDTMIADQRIFMGAGYSFGYDELVSRYLNKVVLKGVRNDFIGKKAETFNIEPQHLLYLMKDLENLDLIKAKQKEKIHKYKMQFLIYGIECALVPVIANAELRGFVLDTEKWLNRVKKEQEEKYQILLNLDRIVRNLRDTLPDVKKDLMVGGKWDKKRIRSDIFDTINLNGTTEFIGLFGNNISVVDLFRNSKLKTPTKNIPKIEEYPGCLKYTKQEIIHIFGALNQLAITDIETFSVPRFLPNGKLEDYNKYSVKEGILQRYLILRPNTILKEFLEEFGKLQKINKSISTYGKSFVNKINEISGKIHTAYGQCFADTGRMTSGGGRNESDKYNSQNIPRNLEMRQAFGSLPTHDVNTGDYGGAELILMASFAQDFRLLELSKGDMHSHFATEAWRAVYRVKATQTSKMFSYGSNMSDEERLKYKAEYADYLKLSQTFIVTKKEPTPEYRQNFKNADFGIIYGAYPKKVGQILNVTVDEAKAIIYSMEKEIPRTFMMVKAQSDFAEKHGYLIHNTRTNSRRWFPNLIRQIKGDISKDTHFLDISDELSAARNSKIQGTQADFVKEASVKLQYFYWKNGFDANIISWVHDEIVDDMKREDSKFLSFIKHEIMTTVANKYLNNVTIDVEMQLFPYWTK